MNGSKTSSSEHNVTSHEEQVLTPESSIRFKLPKSYSHKWLLLWLCCSSVLQGMIVNGMVKTVLTTIEKRYALSSTSSGLISGTYDMGFLLAALPVAYLGGRPGASKPMWIAGGTALMGLGSLTFASPHFFAPAMYTIKKIQAQLVAANSESSLQKLRAPTLCSPLSSSEKVVDKCIKETAQTSHMTLAVFLIGQLFHGAGATTLYTLGVTYLDETVGPSLVALYVGIYYTSGILGAALGFLINGQFLRWYVDWEIDASKYQLTPSSDDWVGAWWIGFLLTGIYGLVVAIPLLTFPRSLHAGHLPAGLNSFSELAKAFWSLCRNIPFVFITLAATCEGLLISGISTFMPKSLESQFSLLPSRASLTVGLVFVPAAGLGTFLGSSAVNRGCIVGSGIPRACALTASVALLLSLGYLIYCPQRTFRGANVGKIPQLDLPCNRNCGCSIVKYRRVFCSDGMDYYSPCYAGCLEMVFSPKNETRGYGKCACVEESRDVMGTCRGPDADGYWETCGLLPVFLALILGSMLTTFMLGMPSLCTSLRCVHEEQRAVSLALQWVAIRILGTFPGPVLFGTVVDMACLIWDNHCPGSGVSSCRLYSNKDFSRYMIALLVCFKGLSIGCFIGAWKTYPKQSSMPNPSVSTPA